MTLPSKPYLRRTIRLLLICIGCYALACAGLVLGERYMVYVPFSGPTEPVQAGLKGYEKHSFKTVDGLDMPYWEHADNRAPILLYFHGNGGGLHAFVPAMQWLADHELNVIAMEYRGYPGAPGQPSEKAIVGDAITLFDAVKKQNPGRRIVIWGYSLGSGVATQLAAARAPDALVLEAPFSATVDRAAQLFPLIPVRYLMRDQFLSREAIGKVTAPVMILHGEDDFIIPIGLGEALYEKANQPKQFKRYPHAGHLDLIDTTAYADALEFIRTNTR